MLLAISMEFVLGWIESSVIQLVGFCQNHAGDVLLEPSEPNQKDFEAQIAFSSTPTTRAGVGRIVYTIGKRYLIK